MSAERTRGELADERDRIADDREAAADARDETADARDRGATKREQSSDIAGLRGEHLSGPWGYRLAVVDRDPSGRIHAQIIDGEGHEVAWARGATTATLISDASRKALAHDSKLDGKA